MNFERLFWAVMIGLPVGLLIGLLATRRLRRLTPSRMTDVELATAKAEADKEFRIVLERSRVIELEIMLRGRTHEQTTLFDEPMEDK